MNTLNLVESVFFAALDKASPEERSAYLNQACSGDDNLRKLVDRLLAAHPQAGQFLQSNSVDPSQTRDNPSEGVVQPGGIIGPYKLLQQLGEGGFGVVYLAEQSTPIHRKVALKIIKPGMDSKQVVARFEVERQALAMMDHPNIARVFDGGITSDASNTTTVYEGRPYFVMELVKGIPITDFCDQNRLSPRERLELFVPVCNAVQHAHQKGIIHRDLKPSNVLVTMYDDKPVPKVIDFGVAKAIEKNLTERTLFTNVGQIIGTLEYMSPEQASFNALDIDTRADVYALGVLLYELLTGTTPLERERLSQVAILEMLRLIREEEPLKPSARLSQTAGGLPMLAAYRKSDSKQLPGLVRGDLDWITMKALEKDRGRRYAAASALAADVQRYLKDEQVEACPPTMGYIFGKFIRRHRAVLGAIGGIAAMLLLGIIGTGWQAIRARDAELKALTNAEQAIKSNAIAQLEREEADVARDFAEKARGIAQMERDLARAAREDLRRAYYFNSMKLIQIAWDAYNLAYARELLQKQIPQAGETDLRGFEWHYWDRLCNSENGKRTLKPELPGPVWSLVVSGDGRRIAFWQSEASKAGGDAFDEPESIDADVKNDIVVQVVDVKSLKCIQSWRIENKGAAAGLLSLNGNGDRVAFLFSDNSESAGTKLKFQRSSPPFRRIVAWNVRDGRAVFEKKGDFSPTLTFSSDGQRLAIAERHVSKPANQNGDPEAGRARKSELKIYDLNDPSTRPTTIDVAGMGSFVFAPDGLRLAAVSVGFSAQSNGTRIVIWDAVQGSIQTDAIHPSNLSHIAFSSDNARLFGVGFAAKSDVSNRERHLMSFDWELGEQKLKLIRSSPVNSLGTWSIVERLAISPSGLLAVSGRNSPVIRVLDSLSGEERHVIRDLDGTRIPAFTRDGKTLIVAEGGRHFINVTEYPLFEDRHPLDLPGKIPPQPPGIGKLREKTVRSPDGKWSATFQTTQPFLNEAVSTDVVIRDATNRILHTFRGHKNDVVFAKFNPNSTLILTQERSGGLRIWEPTTGNVRWSFDPSQLGPGKRSMAQLNSYPWTCDKDTLVALPGPDGVHIRNFEDLSIRYTIGKPNEIYVSQDGRRLVSVHGGANKYAPFDGQPNVFKIWNVETGEVLMEQTAQPAVVRFSSGYRFFTIQRNDRDDGDVLVVWDAKSGSKIASADLGQPKEEKSYRIVRSPILLVSPDGRRAILPTQTGAGRWSPAIFDVTTAARLATFDGNPLLGTIVFSPNGKRVATAGSSLGGEEIKLWDAETGQELLTLKTEAKHLASSGMLRFSNDGHRLNYISTGNRKVISWNATPRALSTP